MNLSKDKVTEIFYFADNFCKEFYKSIEAHAIEEAGKARREPRRKPKMSSGKIELGLIDNREWVMKDRRDCVDSKPDVNRIKQFFLRLRVYSA